MTAVPRQRIALLLQYLGTSFYGWQRQPHHPSVQQTIEEAIALITGHPVVLHGAGRTDTGVHAAGQVAHFDVTSPIPPERWAKVLNNYLPSGILIRESVAVDQQWHARFTATWRRYRYTLYTAELPNLFVKDYSWHYYYGNFCADRVHEALQPLLGEQDLVALQRAGSTRPHARVTVQEAKCWRQGDFVYIEVQCSGFLYGMMRLLVGQLVEVGRGAQTGADFTQRWQEQRRDEVKYAAPPQGLCFLGVGYPENPFTEASRRFLTLSLDQAGQVLLV